MMTFLASRPRVQTRTLFLRTVALCFAMAFSSLYMQLPGLVGDDGVTPLAKSVQKRPIIGWLEHAFTILPSWLGMSLVDTMEAICVCGTLQGMAMAVFPVYETSTTSDITI